MIIAGAGLAGLIAGHIFPQAQIIERAEGPGAMHQALLRFRSDEVSRVTNIPFTPVTVRKGIWLEHDCSFHAPNIQLANLYARKVAGKAINRSIWDVEPVTRYISPPDFYERLIAALEPRLSWGADADQALLNAQWSEPAISTIPLPSLLEAFNIETREAFKRQPIHVSKYRVDAWLHQTIYYPEHRMNAYRASITGDVLIIEGMELIHREDLNLVLHSFGLDQVLEPLGKTEQRFGKIAPINDMVRRELLHRLTETHKVYSVGRFATWRNILLDDVVKDCHWVQRAIAQGDAYERHLRSPDEERIPF